MPGTKSLPHPDDEFDRLARLALLAPDQFSKERDVLIQMAIQAAPNTDASLTFQRSIDTDRYTCSPGMTASRHLLNMSLDSVQALIEAMIELRKAVAAMSLSVGEGDSSDHTH